MIANCPGCGTHYKHEPPKVKVRARCSRCDTSLNLDRLRPYRIAAVAAPTAEQARRAANHLPIGLDHPALATTIAENVARSAARTEVPPAVVMPVRPVEDWEHEDPLPQIPEMSMSQTYEPSISQVQLEAVPQGGKVADVSDEGQLAAAAGAQSTAGRGGATLALSTVAGAIAGTGVIWTVGGPMIAGVAVGAAIGAGANWVWLRWTSQK